MLNDEIFLEILCMLFKRNNKTGLRFFIFAFFFIVGVSNAVSDDILKEMPWHQINFLELECLELSLELR